MQCSTCINYTNNGTILNESFHYAFDSCLIALTFGSQFNITQLRFNHLSPFRDLIQKRCWFGLMLFLCLPMFGLDWFVDVARRRLSLDETLEA